MNASRWLMMISGTCSVLVACGDPATTTGAGGSDGDDGGAPTTLQSVSSSGGGIGDGGNGGAVSSGGDGGDGGSGGQGGAPSECEQTCAMLDACGQPLCGAGGLFDCSVDPPTHNTCWLACVGNASCGEVNAFITGGNAPVLEACMGACDSGAICKQCVADANFPGNDCAPEIAACSVDADCAPWVTCAGGCATKACMDGCDAMHPGGAPLEAVYDCICNVGYCGDVCASVFTCPGP